MEPNLNEIGVSKRTIAGNSRRSAVSTDVGTPAGEPANVRQRILDAALGGSNTTTIDDIETSAGASIDLIYYHFRSKFDIFPAVDFDIFSAVDKEATMLMCARVGHFVDGLGTGFDRRLSMSTEHVLQIMMNLGYHQVVYEGVREQRSVALRPQQPDALAELNGLRADCENLFKSDAVAGALT